MKRLLNQSGAVHTLPLLLIVVAVGIVSYLLISSTAPFKGGLFGNLNPKPQSQAAISNVIDMAYPCGFTNPAFCDNFSEGPAAVKGHGGDLDSKKWAFARVQPAGFGGGSFMYWPMVDQAEHCKTTIFNVYAESDSFFCGSEVPEPEHWMETTQPGFGYNDARPRQPFDFTNRTGMIQYGVDAKHSGHGWWLETWISDEPMMVPATLAGNAQQTNAPKNAIGISFTKTCGFNQDPSLYAAEGTGDTGVEFLLRSQDYRMTNTGEVNTNSANCVTTKDDSSNLFQIKLSTTHMEVWGSDHGSNALKLMYSTDFNPPLPFSVGYVHFEHGQYNPHKCGLIPEDQGGCNPYQTYHWHDMGFDGPIHPTPRAYEIPDPVAHKTDCCGGHYSDVGYQVRTDGQIQDPNGVVNPAFTFNNVDISGATSANLNFELAGVTGLGDTLTYQFNNGPQHIYTVPNSVDYGPGAMGVVIPIPITELVQGTNTLKMKASDNFWNGPNTAGISSMDLEVNLPDSSTPTPFAGMIPCNLMNLMMPVMPQMTMPTDPCSNKPEVGFNTPDATLNYPAGGTIPVSVKATPKGSATSISKVVLTQGTTTLATLTSAPYTFNWANAPLGTYTLTATATDNLGNTAALPITVNVTAATPLITGVYVTNIFGNSATVTWTTDKSSDSQVDFGTTTLYGSSSPLDTTQVTSHSITLTGLSPTTTYHIRAKSKNTAGLTNSADSTFKTIVTSNLTTPWQNQDIGYVGLKGAANLTNGIFTLYGSGYDIFAYNDGFHFAYQQVSGDSSIVAHIGSINSHVDLSKTGVMIRGSLAANSAHALMEISSSRGAFMIERPATGGDSKGVGISPVDSVRAPNWVKLTRVGNTLTGYYSTDGSNWIQVGSDTVAMPINVYIGLAVTSEDETAYNASTFDSISINGAAPLPTPTPGVTPPPGTNSFTGEFWNSGNSSSPGMPTTNADVVRNDPTINFSWGNGSPDPLINPDHFIARWTGNFTFNAGTYTFSTTDDDGVRVYVDNQLIIDHWIDEGPTTYTASKALTAGTHNVRMEYYENTQGAQAVLSWSLTGSTTPTPTIAPTPSSTPGTCPKKSLGDIDCDGTIGIFDFNTLVTNFGKTGVGLSGGDLDGSGKIDIFDFNTLITNFGH